MLASYNPSHANPLDHLFFSLTVPRAAKEIRAHVEAHRLDNAGAAGERSCRRLEEAAPGNAGTEHRSSQEGGGATGGKAHAVAENDSAARQLKEEFGVQDAVVAFALADSGHDLAKARTLLRQILPPDYLATDAEHAGQHGGDSAPGSPAPGHTMCELGKRIEDLSAHEVAELVLSYGGSKEVAEGIVQSNLDGTELSRSPSTPCAPPSLAYVCVCVCACVSMHVCRCIDTTRAYRVSDKCERTSARVFAESALPAPLFLFRFPKLYNLVAGVACFYHGRIGCKLNI